MNSDLFLCPGVLEAYGLVEDGMLGCAVGVDVVVADALELEVGVWGQLLGELLDEGVLVDGEGVGVEEGTHGVYAAYVVLLFVLLDGVSRVFACPEAFVVSHFAWDAMLAAYPVEGLALYLAVCAWHTAPAVGVVGGVDADDVAL